MDNKKISKLNKFFTKSDRSGSSDLYHKEKHRRDVCLKTLLFGLYAARFLIILIPQYGYLQPDEFHQFTEPLASKFMNVETLKCWEFTREQPLRSMILPQLIAGPIFKFFQYFFHGDYRSLPSYFILVLPRLVMVLFTFLIDFSLDHLVLMINSTLRSNSTNRIRLCLALIHSSTYLAFTYYHRTFTTTIETILIAILLLAIFDSLTKHHRKLKPKATISALLVMGFFNRPTFAIFASVPMIYWILAYRVDKSTQEFLSIKIIVSNSFKNIFNVFQTFSIISLMFILGDSYYYGKLNFQIEYLNIQDFQNYQNILSNLVITPWNFIQYNMYRSNLANHGLHPFYFHLIVCFPLMFTLLALVAYYQWTKIALKFLTNGNRKRFLVQTWNDFYYSQPRDQFSMILHLSIMVSLLCLSVIPHHEPRFLMPLIIPLILVFSYRFGSLLADFKSVLWLWISVQIILITFFGFIHQAGIVPSLMYLKQNHYEDFVRTFNVYSNTNQSTEIIFARMYLPPRHLLLLPQDYHQNLNLHIHDYSVEPLVPSLNSTFHKLLNDFAQHQLISGQDGGYQINTFLILPSCYDELMKKILYESLQSYHPFILKQNIHLLLLHIQFPNFTAEDLDQCLMVLMGQEPQITNNIKTKDISYLSQIPKFYSNINLWASRIRRAFGMSIWKIEFK